LFINHKLSCHRKSNFYYVTLQELPISLVIEYDLTNNTYIFLGGFNVHGSVHRNNILIYIYPTRCNVRQFILSVNCSTCFGLYLHPSSEALTTVSTASGICHTVIAIFRWFQCAVVAVRNPQHTQTGSKSSTIAADINNGVTNTICCRCNCLCSWWWVMVPPETCRAVSR